MTWRLDGTTTAHSPPNKNKFRCQHITSQLIVSRELAVSPVLLCLLSRRFRFFSRLVVLIDSRLNQLSALDSTLNYVSPSFFKNSPSLGGHNVSTVSSKCCSLHASKNRNFQRGMGNVSSGAWSPVNCNCMGKVQNSDSLLCKLTLFLPPCLSARAWLWLSLLDNWQKRYCYQLLLAFR